MAVTSWFSKQIWTLAGEPSYQSMMRHVLQLLALSSALLAAVVSSSAVEVKSGSPSPVTETTLLTSDTDIMPLAMTGHHDEFGVLFHSDGDYWFSIVRGEGELTTIDLMSVADLGYLSLPDEGAVLWTGDEYLLFWRYGRDVFQARITADGAIISMGPILEAGEGGTRGFESAWNGTIDRGMIIWGGQAALFGADGTILETFTLGHLPETRHSITSLTAYGKGFASVSRVLTPSHTTRPIIQRFDPSGARAEIIRFGEHARAEVASCDNSLLVLEYGSVGSHSAHNVYRVDGDGAITSFNTLWQTPEDVPYPFVVISCDSSGFQMVTRLGDLTFIDQVVDGAVMKHQAWEGVGAYAAAKAGRFVLLAGRTAYRWDENLPDAIVEIPLLLSAAGEVPLAAESRGGKDVFILEDRGEAYVLTLDEERRTLRPLPPIGNDVDLAISRDGKRALITYSDETGILGIPVDLESSQPSSWTFVISTTSGDRNPAVAAHPDGFLVVWERELYRDTGTLRSGVVGRIIPEAGHPSEPERLLLPAEETGHYTPLLRSWSDGYLLLTSTGTVCWRAGCILQTPLDLEVTRLDASLQPLWSKVVDNSIDRNEVPADAACEGDRCFLAWSRENRGGNPCVTFARQSSVAAGLIHDQGFMSSFTILDEPGVNDLNPTVSLIDGHWFLVWVTEGPDDCEVKRAADLRGSVFNRSGIQLPIDGESTVSIASRSQDERHPHLLDGRLYYSMTTPESGTGAAERLHVLTIEVSSDGEERRRPVRR